MFTITRQKFIRANFLTNIYVEEKSSHIAITYNLKFLTNDYFMVSDSDFPNYFYALRYFMFGKKQPFKLSETTSININVMSSIC